MPKQNPDITPIVTMAKSAIRVPYGAQPRSKNERGAANTPPRAFPFPAEEKIRAARPNMHPTACNADTAREEIAAKNAAEKFA